MIIWPNKSAVTVLDAFKTRFNMHRDVYQHHVTKRVEAMLVDAMVKANKHISFPSTDAYCGPRDADGNKPAMLTLAQSIFDPGAFLLVDDGIKEEIKTHLMKFSALKRRMLTGVTLPGGGGESAFERYEKDLTYAKRVLYRVERRNLYKVLLGRHYLQDAQGSAYTCPSRADPRRRVPVQSMSEMEIMVSIVDAAKKFEKNEPPLFYPDGRPLTLDIAHLRVMFVSMHHGQRVGALLCSALLCSALLYFALPYSVLLCSNLL